MQEILTGRSTPGAIGSKFTGIEQSNMIFLGKLSDAHGRVEVPRAQQYNLRVQ